jgi:hypothetical protein
MESPFGNPKEVNPFQDVPLEAIPVARPVYYVVHEPVVVVCDGERKRWLELPGAFCIAYFCGPCYAFAYLCCAVIH